MLTTVINIADLNIKVIHSYPYFKDFSKKYLTDSLLVDFTVSVDQNDIIFEKNKCIEESEYENIPYQNFPDEYLETTAIYRKIAQVLPKYNAIIFHGSAVAVENKAYIFTAKSGTGKTTHTLLWLKNIKNSFIVNGDKPIIRIFDNGIKVCGTPWCGKENLGANVQIPLSSICILNRGETNTIEKITFNDAISMLIGQTYCSPDTEILTETLKTLEKITNNVTLYKLYCNMEDDASLVAFKAMSDNN